MSVASIGVLDSGMGGLSVLRALRSALPHERFVYFGDSANAPYGSRSPEEIRALTMRAAKALMQRHIKALLIACNTASSASEDMLRAALPVPVVGMEPELGLAAAAAGGKRVIVFATEATLSLPRYLAAREAFCPDAISIPAPELVLMVERGVVSGPEPENYFRSVLSAYPLEEVGAVVLGCTHFAFLRGALQKLMPGVPLFDGSQTACRALSAALERAGLLSNGGAGGIELLTSSTDPDMPDRMRALLAENLS